MRHQTRTHTGQSRGMSIAESIISVCIGYVLTVLIQLYLYPRFGVTLPLDTTLAISLVIVALAFVKNYTVRRLFNLVQQRRHNAG